MKNGWIKCSERLPDNSLIKDYFVINSWGAISAATYYDGFKTSLDLGVSVNMDIVAWLPITDEGWHIASYELPEKDGTYLVLTTSKSLFTVNYAEGFNCYRYNGKVDRELELTSVYAWKEIPKYEDPDREIEEMVDRIINKITDDNNQYADYTNQHILDDLEILRDKIRG